MNLYAVVKNKWYGKATSVPKYHTMKT